jgi:solute carrier family 35 protein C2
VPKPSDKKNADMVDSNDRFQLETLRSPADSSRPTIPYSQFPRPVLPNLATSFEGSSRARVDGSSSDDLKITYSSDVYSPDNMDLNVPSSHRRRRSSLMNSLNGSAHKPHAQSWRKQRGRQGIQEDWKETKTDDDSFSTSEDHEMDRMSEDDGINDDEETGLTEQDTRKRRRKRKRDTRMDQRIVGQSAATAAEKKEANQAVLKEMFINSLLIALW